MRFAVTLIVAAMLASCATVGTDYSDATIASLQPGMSQQDVVARLGRPNVKTSLADGTEQWIWTFAKASAFGAARSKAIMLQFGPDKRFLRVMSETETQVR